MKSITSQLTKIGAILRSRNPIKTSDTYNLVPANRSPTVGLLQNLAATSFIGAFKAYRRLKDLAQGKKPVVKEYPKDTVILFQFPRAYDLPSLSPFALRLETWLRAAGIKYKSVGTVEPSSQGLIPYIKLNGIQVEDSGVIIDYLSQVFNIDMDAHLTDEQKAQAHAVLKLSELSLFMCMGFHRFWLARNGRKDIHLPLLSYWFFSYRIYRRAWYAGYGRLPAEEIYKIGRRDLTALDTIVGSKKFLFSETKPCNTDFMLFGICAQIKYTDRGPLNLHFISECKNLNRYVETIREIYWPDWTQNTQAFQIAKAKAAKIAALPASSPPKK